MKLCKFNKRGSCKFQIMDKLLLVSMYLYFGAAIIRGQLQLTDIKVLQRGSGMCSSMEERERAKNDIHQITNSIIGQIEDGGKNATIMERNNTYQMNDSTTIANTCGTLGWRRVTFINMTNTSYTCPAGLQLTSNSTRACGRSHTGAGCSSTKFSIESNQYSQVYMWQDKDVPARRDYCVWFIQTRHQQPLC